MQSKLKKIVLCGGHAATTALAVVEEFVRREGEKEAFDIYWIGTTKAVEGKNIPTLESVIFPKVSVKTYAIVAGRIQRRLTVWTIPSLFKIPLGIIHAFVLLLKIHPDIIVSFGGFAGFSVAFAGWIMKVPVVIHEQTIAAGLANRASAPFATKIALAREQSLKFFPREKCKVVGNPVLTQIAEIKPKPKIGEPPVIFVMGGSRGAQRINVLIGSILDRLLERYRVIHITGQLDYESFAGRKAKNYEVYPLVDPMKIDGIYREADVVIARAGANTVSEVIATKRPAIFIPIPWSYNDEQTKNAIFASEFGIAKVLPEKGISGEKLFSEVGKIIADWQTIIKRVSGKESPDAGAAGKLVDLIYETL